MTFLRETFGNPIAIAIVLSAGIIVSSLIDTWLATRELENIVYRGKRELNISALLLKMATVSALIVLSAVALSLLQGCASAPKPNQIPLQAEPVKAEKTTIKTWMDFFEPRD